MSKSKLIGVSEAAKLTGLSVHMIRKGIKSGRFPAFQMSSRGKFLLDAELLAQTLEQESLSNIKSRA